MKDPLIITADMDLSMVEKKLSELQNKLKSFQNMNPGAAGMVGLGGGNQQITDRMKQTQLTMHKRLQSEVTSELTKQSKAYTDVTKTLDSQIAKQKLMIKETKAYAELTAEIAKNREKEFQHATNINRLTAQRQNIQAMDPRSFDQMGGMGRLRKALETGGLGGMNRAAKRMGLGGLGGMALSGIAGAAAGAGQLGLQYGRFKGFQAELPVMQAEREGAIAGVAGQARGRYMRGEGLEDILFAKERERAFGQTKNYFTEANAARNTRAKSSALKGVGGIAGGTITGAAIGGMIAGPLGALAGGVIGGVGAGFKYFGGDEEAYYGLTGNKKELAKMTGKDAMERNAIFERKEKMKNLPLYYQKKMISENMGDFLKTGRSGRLSDNEMTDYMLSGSKDFLLNERMNMSQQIVGAGGSGSGATRGGLNTLALKAQRSMGLTNSGQALGKLSGYMGANESEDAFVRILSKGVSIGLDDSKFAEEQKDYLIQVSSIASRIGGGEELVSASLAAGLEGGPITRRGVQMAAEGFGAVESALNKTGGVTAAARASMISGSDQFSNIKGIDRLALQNMKMGDINDKSEMMKMFFEKQTGKSADEDPEGFSKFVKDRQDIQRKALFKPYEGTAIGDILQKGYDEGKKGKLSKKTQAEISSVLPFVSDEFKSMYEKQLGKSGNVLFRAEGVGESGKGNEGTVRSRLEKYLNSFEKLNKGLATQQSKQFENLKGNFDTIFAEIGDSIDTSLTQQMNMEDFNEALKGGAAAVDLFIKALNGEIVSPESKLSSSSTTKGTGLKERAGREFAAGSGKKMKNVKASRGKTPGGASGEMY